MKQLSSFESEICRIITDGGIGIAEFKFRTNASIGDLLEAMEGDVRDEEINDLFVRLSNQRTGAYVGEIRIPAEKIRSWRNGEEDRDDFIGNDSGFLFFDMSGTSLLSGECLMMELDFDGNEEEEKSGLRCTWGDCKLIVKNEAGPFATRQSFLSR